jgi:ATP-dependent Clp protease ATP-binding subunit ClpC
VEGIVSRTAHEIAREYEQEWVGTEHVLMAISKEGTGLGAKILSQHEAGYEQIKEQVDLLMKKSMEDTWVFGRLPGTPHFKNVMASAVEAARELESKEVCTEHLLLALLREKGSVAYNALEALGLKIATVKNDIIEAA